MNCHFFVSQKTVTVIKATIDEGMSIALWHVLRLLEETRSAHDKMWASIVNMIIQNDSACQLLLNSDSRGRWRVQSQSILIFLKNLWTLCVYQIWSGKVAVSQIDFSDPQEDYNIGWKPSMQLSPTVSIIAAAITICWCLITYDLSFFLSFSFWVSDICYSAEAILSFFGPLYYTPGQCL